MRVCYELEFQLKNEKGFNCRLLDCSPETSLMDILHIMSKYHIRRLPVIAVSNWFDFPTCRMVQWVMDRMTKHWVFWPTVVFCIISSLPLINPPPFINILSKSSIWVCIKILFPVHPPHQLPKVWTKPSLNVVLYQSSLALFMLESKNISSILVTNEEGRMTTIFQRSDIFKLDIMDINLFEQPLCSIPALVSEYEDDSVIY